MKTLKYIITLVIVVLLSDGLMAQQKNKKIWVSGAARGVMYGDSYNNTTEADTVTPKRLESGHAMVDLGVNIQPNDWIQIQGMVRIRNDYGGFWGSGVTFDVRQLYIKGIIGGFLKYQLGDINYKLTPYTFQNNVGLVNSFKGAITGIPLDQVQYDLFYMKDQTWRQQGLAIDFALEFSKAIEEIKFDLYTTRVLANAITTDSDDRLYSGGAITFRQSKYLNFGVQYANLYDLEGTSASTVQVSNPVTTGSVEGTYWLSSTKLSLALEGGQSSLQWNGGENTPVLEDYFYDVNLRAAWEKTGIGVTAGYRDVGPNFRSAGAQTIQINYNSSPLAYQRYGNDQQLRPITMLDLYRDASLYNTQIATGLMDYDPRYDNATPYGRATPNRKGLNLAVDYTDVKERWVVELTTDILTDVVGQGTTALKGYTTGALFAELRLNHLLGWADRKFWISGRTGLQSTSRSGSQSFETVDLDTRFNNVNLTLTLFADLDLIGEWRTWQTKGFDLVAERNQYSEIVNYNEYNIDYSEQIYGAGLQYNFSEKTRLSLMWQNFEWNDELELTQNYTIGTWNLFFTMNF